jgi:hypothetical protein
MAQEVLELEAVETIDGVLDRLRDEAGPNGFQNRLDDTHTVTFVPRGPKLLVTFEKLQDTLSSPGGLPIGLDFVDDKNWSLLHFATEADTWFRSEDVFECFDDLVDDSFFEEFDQILFFGAGMCGYAAAAFSVVAPGSAVLAISPQASLAPDRTRWDHRFPVARRGLEFEKRYGYAPEMLEGASVGYILHDPYEKLDAVHASLFRGDNIVQLKCNHLRDKIPSALRDMDLLHQLIEKAASQSLTPAVFHKMFRARRTHSTYLRNMLFQLDEQNKPLRMALLCAHVLSQMKAPAFRRRLHNARDSLILAGKMPDWLRDFQ